MTPIPQHAAQHSQEPSEWLFGTDEPRFVMEAHDGLSAIIARKAGFSSLWASGLGISTSLGYRDSNEASWSSVADVVERMAEASGLPVLVDGDTGFGNFNNARIFARSIARRGARGLCIEDKQFPKLNSFVGDRHMLADAEEFSGRLRAIKDTCPDLVLIARTEALIAGAGMAEALERAHAYADAGVDGVLVHSRKSDAGEILDFASRWRNRLPVIIVPTRYYETPVSLYRKAGISTVIWANQSLRASVRAMREVSSRIFVDKGVSGVEAGISSLKDLFELLDYDELGEAEQRYLPR
ncbi:phosphoenolpyruvate mutase [Agrobacterium rhizogenes]|uniref:phosphoenolpyruvate mutase n=1 Tax=Rhizobium rhizogenes TaxID=359 RepID=UPI0022B74A6C|nr:phosphoenolpyruvate mutase [Rhizobium rhizogenes]MCZ7450272.1 phosphoenolpyruvate mutase [Rhizobium rhizogenes]